MSLSDPIAHHVSAAQNPPSSTNNEATNPILGKESPDCVTPSIIEIGYRSNNEQPANPKRRQNTFDLTSLALSCQKARNSIATISNARPAMTKIEKQPQTERAYPETVDRSEPHAMILTPNDVLQSSATGHLVNVKIFIKRRDL